MVGAGERLQRRQHVLGRRCAHNLVHLPSRQTPIVLAPLLANTFLSCLPDWNPDDSPDKRQRRRAVRTLGRVCSTAAARHMALGARLVAQNEGPGADDVHADQDGACGVNPPDGLHLPTQQSCLEHVSACGAWQVCLCCCIPRACATLSVCSYARLFCTRSICAGGKRTWLAMAPKPIAARLLMMSLRWSSASASIESDVFCSATQYTAPAGCPRHATGWSAYNLPCLQGG